MASRDGRVPTVRAKLLLSRELEHVQNWPSVQQATGGGNWQQRLGRSLALPMTSLTLKTEDLPH